MNSEMKAKLEKYMQTDGTYNIAAIREEYPGDIRSAFNAMWSDDGESANEDPDASLKYMSAEWRAAVEYNEALESNEQMVNDLSTLKGVGTVPQSRISKGSHENAIRLDEQGYRLWVHSGKYEDSDMPAYFKNHPEQYRYHVTETTTMKLGNLERSTTRTYVLLQVPVEATGS